MVPFQRSVQTMRDDSIYRHLTAASCRNRLRLDREATIMEHQLCELRTAWLRKLSSIARERDTCTPAERRQLSRWFVAMRILRNRLELCLLAQGPSCLQTHLGLPTREKPS
jgi:hypothetical protein